VLQRCRTYKQTETATSITANWGVQLNDLPMDCTILDITRLLSGRMRASLCCGIIVILSIVHSVVVVIATFNAARMVNYF